MNDRETRKKDITTLVESYYNEYEFLHYEPLSHLINRSLEVFLDSDLDIDQINTELASAVKERKRQIDNRYDEKKVQENHDEIYSKLEQLIGLLNEEGIDYQLAGSLCGYLKYEEESDRCHDDIDINLNELDIDKFKRVCLKMGLNFKDNRITSPRVLKNGIPSGEHEVIATLDGSDFHIGAFCFERLADGTVINKGYYHDENGNPCAREEILSPELARETFGHEKITFRGQELFITPPEQIYLFKKYTKSEKDLHDIGFLEDKIDADKVMRIRSLNKTDRHIQFVPVHSLPNPYERSEEDELVSMLEDKKEEVKKKERGKVLRKESNEGFATKYAIIVTMFLVIVCILIIVVSLK